MNNKIKPSDYVNIQGWMRTKLGLNGNQLMLYALIHGFSRDGQTEFTGSYEYIMEWLGCSRRTVIYTLNELTEKGLVFKRDWVDTHGSNTAYKVNFDKIAELTVVGGAKIAPQGCKNCTVGGAKIAPNNLSNNIYPPITPQGECDDVLTGDALERFDVFWSAYPRKVNKLASKKAWKKLMVTDELLQSMLHAIAVQKLTEQWSKEEHIPHPSTWLNGHRWNDEVTGAQSAAPEKEEEFLV